MFFSTCARLVPDVTEDICCLGVDRTLTGDKNEVARAHGG